MNITFLLKERSWSRLSSESYMFTSEYYGLEMSCQPILRKDELAFEFFLEKIVLFRTCIRTDFVFPFLFNHYSFSFELSLSLPLDDRKPRSPVMWECFHFLWKIVLVWTCIRTDFVFLFLFNLLPFFIWIIPLPPSRWQGTKFSGDERVGLFCRLFNAKSTFMQIICSIENSSV